MTYFRLGQVLGEYRYSIEEAAKIADPEEKAAYMRLYYAERSELQGLSQAERFTYTADLVADQVRAQQNSAARAASARTQNWEPQLELDTPKLVMIGAAALAGAFLLRRMLA